VRGAVGHSITTQVESNGPSVGSGQWIVGSGGATAEIHDILIGLPGTGHHRHLRRDAKISLKTDEKWKVFSQRPRPLAGAVANGLAAN